MIARLSTNVIIWFWEPSISEHTILYLLLVLDIGRGEVNVD